MVTTETEVISRLGKIEQLLDSILKEKTRKDWYSTDEVAKLLNKAEFTVREWCRLGRIHAEKRNSGRGPHAAWVISHKELLRYQHEGLLPLDADLGVPLRPPRKG